MKLVFQKNVFDIEQNGSVMLFKNGILFTDKINSENKNNCEEKIRSILRKWQQRNSHDKSSSLFAIDQPII